MWIQARRLALLAFLVLLPADRARAQGDVLETKEELRLKYDVAVRDLGDGRVSVEFTLGDEGRLKPLSRVELNVAGSENDKGADLAVAMEMKANTDGTRVARVELRKQLAERAAVWLTTATFDGKRVAAAPYQHIVPVAAHMNGRPSPPAAGEALWDKMFRLMYVAPQAARVAQLAELKSLLDQGADPNMAIGFDRMLRVGETHADLRPTDWPLDLAAYHGRADMVKLLLERGAKPHGKELARAASATNQEDAFAMVSALVKAGADVNSRSESFTALFWASARGNKAMVKLLLERPGIKIDLANDDGSTALMTAVEHGHTEVVDMLLAAGANVGIKDRRGETAATLAKKALASQQAAVAKRQAVVAKLQASPK